MLFCDILNMKDIFAFAFGVVLLKLTFSVGSQTLCTIRSESGKIKDVCCADFEKMNSICVACMIGYTSNAGERCRPCAGKTYGLRCGETCNCDDFERCDKQIGCVLMTTATTANTTAASDYTHRINTDITTVLPITVTDRTSGGNGTGKHSGSLSLRETIVYYTLSVTVIVLLLCLCYTLIRKRANKKKRTQSITLETVRTIPNAQAVRQPVIAESLYDIIDESEADQSQNAEATENDYLEVINDSASSKSSCAEKSTPNSYTNPYQPLVSTDHKMGSYEKLHHLVTAELACIRPNQDFFLQDSSKLQNTSPPDTCTRKYLLNDRKFDDEVEGKPKLYPDKYEKQTFEKKRLQSKSSYNLTENALPISNSLEKMKTL